MDLKDIMKETRVRDDIELNLDSFIFHQYGHKTLERLYTAVFNNAYDWMYINEELESSGNEYYNTLLNNTRKEIVAYTKLNGALEDYELDRIFEGIEKKIKVK